MLRHRGRTYSPFSGRAGRRRMGMTRADIVALEESIQRVDATADQMRALHPGIEIIYGDKESYLEKRFPFLRRRRQRY